ncbi:hypothetical protein CK203_044623 [Vitis vinifera]|uniref:Uncharacterized protein n=1 Tax=Vitis vinifera TaxID=29760 RepID=A0A438HJR7_VITVI|nr:hypothetical protein CK203_044623 [Vitis vinifera]
MNWKKQRRNTLHLMTSPSILIFYKFESFWKLKASPPSTGMKDCLYDLSIALTDCILFLEKRKMKINKDSSQGQGQGQGQGQRQGHYSLPELWFLCKTKRKLIHIKKKLRVATSHPVVPEHTSFSAVTDVATTSSSSGSLSFDGPTIDPYYSYYFTDQCDGGQRDSVEVEEEELLEALCKALWSKSYLLVFDGIWISTWTGYFSWDDILELAPGGKLVYYVMINPKDDANQGNDLLLSLRSIFATELVSDISEVVPQLPLDEVVDRVRILVS